MKVIDCEQGSEAWSEIRLGMVTASRFSDVLAKGTGKTRKSYMVQLAGEIMEQKQMKTHFDKNMEAGQIKEPLAREYYEALYGVTVEQVGFVELNDDVGCSPDGLIRSDGMLEIKCPLATTHIRYIEGGVLPPAYTAQVQGGLWVTGREWCDFMSFRPENRQRPHFIVRVSRDKEYIKELSIQVTMFVLELKRLVEKFEPEF